MPQLAIIYEHDTLAAPGLRDNSTSRRDRASKQPGYKPQVHSNHYVWFASRQFAASRPGGFVAGQSSVVSTDAASLPCSEVASLATVRRK